MTYMNKKLLRAAWNYWIKSNVFSMRMRVYIFLAIRKLQANICTLYVGRCEPMSSEKERLYVTKASRQGGSLWRVLWAMGSTGWAVLGLREHSPRNILLLWVLFLGSSTDKSFFFIGFCLSAVPAACIIAFTVVIRQCLLCQKLAVSSFLSSKYLLWIFSSGAASIMFFLALIIWSTLFLGILDEIAIEFSFLETMSATWILPYTRSRIF